MRRYPEKTKSLLYVGRSMNPLLRDLDRLFYHPYVDREIRVGDVVVVDSPERKVIHRVLSVGIDGVVTGGDNNFFNDPWLLDPSQIDGRVVYIHRGDRTLPIYGGLRGRVTSAPWRIYRRFLGYLFRLIKPYYRMATKCKPFAFFPINVKAFSFQSPRGEELQLFVGKRVIGRKKPGSEWEIQPPFRLFIDLDAINETYSFTKIG